MASNDPPRKLLDFKTIPKSEDLDMIANFMDTILNNMKSHIQTIQKNKTSDSSSISSDLQNFVNAAQKGPLDTQTLFKSEVSNQSKNSPTESETPLRVEAKNSQTKNTQNKKSQNKNSQNKKRMNSYTTKGHTSSTTQNAQKKNVNNNTTKPNLNRNSNIRSNSAVKTNNSLSPKASPRKMQVVYKDNDKFVSKSLTTMLKETNKPKIMTVSLNATISRPSTTSPHRRKNISNLNANSRSKSLNKPVNTIQNPVQQTSASHNHMRTKSITSNMSRNTTNSIRPKSIKSGSENKKPSLYVTQKELMEKHIHRSNHNLRPMSVNSDRHSSCGNNNNNNSNTTSRTQSLNSKPVTRTRNKSPVSPNRNIANQKTNKRPPQQNKAQNEIKKPQITKPIEIINRINFQNGKKSIECIKQIHIPLPPEITRLPTIESKPATPISVHQIITSKPDTPIKFMKNKENTKIQQSEDKEPTKTNTDNKEKDSETKSDDETSETSTTNINEMGDSSITVINEKIQEIIDTLKDEKENAKESCPGNCLTEPENKEDESSKINSVPVASTQQVVAKVSTPMKPAVFHQNNNKNINNNNRIYINKSHQSRQNMNHHKKSSSIIVKPHIVTKRTSVNSTSLVPRTPNYFIISPNKKFSSLTPMEIVQDFVNLVNRAKRDRKTFTVCGNYFSIRRAFAERGWVEKVRINLIDNKESWRKLENLSNFELVEGIKDKENGDKYKRIFISKLLAGHQVDFYWDYMTNPFSVNNDKIKRTLINRFPFGASRSYTSKAGLCESLKDAYWYYIEGYSNILFPRTYNLVYDDEVHAFIEDFRRTAILSLLQWVTKRVDKPNSIISPTGQIPTSVFNFATMQCYNLIKTKEHKDIDEVIPAAKEYEWEIFLEKYYKIVHQGNHFKETQNISAPLLIDQAKYILNKLRKYYPQIDYDGNLNLWLLKPNNGSRGCGIHVCRTLRYTLDTIHSRKDTKYVIQKYLERPLLIHNTKFDIRQWFMITCMPTLQVWLYKDCYLRFSSQMYDLSKLHESIHLTNNSIQCRYKNNCNRSNDLPEQNMWHSDTFRKYLTDIGQPYAWRNTIYKGIKECLIGLFMLCQDKLLTRVNSFELCGADFMLAEDYRPYLIEINSRPALYPSTRITAKMCPKVLEDVVKVTIDYARNPRASTGQFELIYKDTFSYIPPKNLNTLYIEGINYKKYAEEQVAKKIQPRPVEKISIKEMDDNSGTIQKILKIDPNKVRKDVKNTLEKILAIIHAEQHKTGGDRSSDEKNKQFRMMLSEFVDIISCVKKKSD